MFKRPGTLLLEAIIATGVAASFTTAVLHLALLSNEALAKIEGHGQANFLAQQAVDSVMTIDFADVMNVTNGKTVFDGSEWNITAGQEVLGNGMIRRVTIADVSRDANCLVVSSGGTVDPDSKLITGSVQWTDITGVNKVITHIRHRTNWQDPTGPCFGPSMAENILVDFSGAVFAGGKNLRGVYITNTGSSPVTIVSMVLTWNTPRTMDQIFITDSGGDNKVWSSTGPGSPAGAQPTGTVIDIVDRTINPGIQAELNKIKFSDNMPGSTLTLELTFSDASVLTIGPMTPP